MSSSLISGGPVTKVRFFYQGINPYLKNRTKLKKHLLYILKKEAKNLASLNFIFCTDKNLLEINRAYLGHDYFTDIITFDLSETGNIQGEIYISIDRVRENAGEFGNTFKSELLRVIFHGVLHLCGYNDKSKREKEKMREKEDYYLKKYDLGLSSSN